MRRRWIFLRAATIEGYQWLRVVVEEFGLWLLIVGLLFGVTITSSVLLFAGWKWALVVVAAVVVIVVLEGTYRLWDQSDTEKAMAASDRDRLMSHLQPAETTIPAPEPPRVFVAGNVTPAYLVGLGTVGMLGYQLEALRKPFRGKWMHISGTVADVQIPESGYGHVTLAKPADGPALYLSFQPDWQERLSTLIAGSAISAIGRIQSIDTSVVGMPYIGFERCALDTTK